MERKKPDVETLLDILSQHAVDYVVTGSAAALLHGVALEPGDLDVTPALDHENARAVAPRSAADRCASAAG